MKLKIDKIYRNTARKDGKPYLTKDNKPFVMVTIVSDGRSFSCCDFDGWTETIAEGMTVDVSVTEKEVDGKTFMNFGKPTKLDMAIERIQMLERAVGVLKTEIQKLKEKGLPKQEEVAANDLPF